MDLTMDDPALFKLAFQASPTAQLILSHRRVAAANIAMGTLFGYPPDSLVGGPVRKLYLSVEDYAAIGDRCAEWLKSHRSYEDARFMLRADGELLWVRASGVTLTPDDPFRLMIWSFEHVAERASAFSELTRREKEVANLVIDGKTSREVADTLRISIRTAEVHRAQLMKKLAARNTAELVAHILRTNISGAVD
jgi:PAS domain S-box-containing protein